jgi:hypothetical protein
MLGGLGPDPDRGRLVHTSGYAIPGPEGPGHRLQGLRLVAGRL